MNNHSAIFSLFCYHHYTYDQIKDSVDIISFDMISKIARLIASPLCRIQTRMLSSKASLNPSDMLVDNHL